MSKYRIYSEQGDYGRRTKLAILIEHVDGGIGIAAPLMFNHQVDGAFPQAYTLETKNGDLDGRALLQAMLDHAWELGMRPSGVPEADTTKQVAALREHLTDLRALVFKDKVEPAPNPFFRIVREG